MCGMMLRSRVGSKLAGRLLTARATIERKSVNGWYTVKDCISCSVEDQGSGRAPLSADPTGASTERVQAWLVLFLLGNDVRQGDRLTIIDPMTPNIPTLIVSSPFRDGFGDTHDVIAVAEEQATETEWVAFRRPVDDGDDEDVGTFAVHVSWDAREPQTTGTNSAIGRYQTCTMTGATPLPVNIGDQVTELHDRVAGVVVDVRPITAGRRELRVRFDIGVA